MTYVITPQGKAFHIDSNHTFVVKNKFDQTADHALPLSYHVTTTTTPYNSVQISPDHYLQPWIEADHTPEEANDAAFYEAVQWLEDFLIRLSKNPTIIHCTVDGEMFIK